MKPTIGRIVHVPVDPRVNNGADTAPAVITRVWSDTCVNLRIFHDGPSVPPEGSHRQDWVTSWVLHESRDALQAAHIAAWGERAGEVPLSGAFWPPRVEHDPGDRPPRF